LPGPPYNDDDVLSGDPLTKAYPLELRQMAYQPEE